MSLKLIFFGRPGSGKDTQAHRLAQQFSLPVFSMGGLLREEIKKDTELGRLVAPYVSSGTIIPNGIAGRIMQEHILNPDIQQSGYICINYPRTQGSFAQYLSWDRPTLVVVLEISAEEARARLLTRGREDDTPQGIDARLNAYTETNVSLYKWFEEANIPITFIDGTKTIQEVTEDILKSLPHS